MAYPYGRRRERIRELLATGRVDNETLDELTSLLGGDASAAQVDPRETAPLMRPDDVIRVWALDRGLVDEPMPRDRPVPDEVQMLFARMQRVARGEIDD